MRSSTQPSSSRDARSGGIGRTESSRTKPSGPSRSGSSRYRFWSRDDEGSGGARSFASVQSDVERFFKTDIAMAVTDAELSNSIIAGRAMLDDKKLSQMTDHQKEAFDETIKLIGLTPVRPGNLSDFDVAFQPHPRRDLETIFGTQSAVNILHQDGKYLGLKRQLANLRVWWAEATKRWQKQRHTCMIQAEDLDRNKREHEAIEKSLVRLNTRAQQSGAALQLHKLARNIRTQEKDLFETLEKFTETRQYMRAVQLWFKDMQNSIRHMERGPQAPTEWGREQRPKEFDYANHLPDKDVKKTDWWKSKGFEWWADLALSHVERTTTDLKALLQSCESAVETHRIGKSSTRHSYKSLRGERDSARVELEGIHNAANSYHIQRKLETVETKLSEERDRFDAYKAGIGKLDFIIFCYKVTLTRQRAVRAILRNQITARFSRGYYRSVPILELVHGIVCLNMLNYADILLMRDVLENDAFTNEDLHFLDDLSDNQQASNDREKRATIEKLSDVAKMAAPSRADLQICLDASLEENDKFDTLLRHAQRLLRERALTQTAPLETLEEVMETLDLGPESREEDLHPTTGLVHIDHDEMSQFFRSPDVSHRFRRDGWEFEKDELLAIVQSLLQRPPDEEQFDRFLEYCNDVEELFLTSTTTNKVRKRPVGWELLDETLMISSSLARAENRLPIPDGFHEATEIIRKYATKLYTTTRRDTYLWEVFSWYNSVAPSTVDIDTFTDYVDAWSDRGIFLVGIGEESNGTLLRIIDNGWTHLRPGKERYSPLWFEPPCWKPIYQLLIEPTIAEIWQPRLKADRIRTAHDFYLLIQAAHKAADEKERNDPQGRYSLKKWIPIRKLKLTSYKVLLFLRYFESKYRTITLDRTKRLYDNGMATMDVARDPEEVIIGFESPT